MKILLLLLLLKTTMGFGQEFQGHNSFSDCGYWKKDKTVVTSWQNTDTLKLNLKADTAWVYSDWKTYDSGVVLTVYCPCGCGWETKRYMDRVSDVGIIQRRWEVTSYKYIPKPKTEFEEKVNKLR